MFTNSPEGDAERWNNEQDMREQEAEYEAKRLAEQEKESALKFENALSCDPADWFEASVVVSEKGFKYSPDELAVDAIGLEKNAKARHLFAVLMTSPEAKELREEIARCNAAYWPEACDFK